MALGSDDKLLRQTGLPSALSIFDFKTRQKTTKHATATAQWGGLIFSVTVSDIPAILYLGHMCGHDEKQCIEDVNTGTNS